MNYEVKDLPLAEAEGYRSIGDKPYGVDAGLTSQDCPFGIAEVGIYIDQLIRKNGPAPDGLSFFILRVDHSFGVDFKAAIQFLNCTDKMDRYITKLENGVKKWDETALAELHRINHPFYRNGKRP
jgi:hypothetical protein